MARRRVETPPGVQAQADWAHFPQVVIGGEVKNLIAFKMVLSHSRKDAIVWSESKDMLLPGVDPASLHASNFALA